MEPSQDLNEFLNYLSFQVACELEVNNINFKAADKLIFKDPINLN